MQVRTAVWVLLAIAWAAVSAADPSDDVGEQQRRELERIATLGYVTGSERAPDGSGVTVRDSAACDGYTLCVSRGYPGAFLVDLDGGVVHSWKEDGPKEWTRAWVYPNGDVLSISAYPARLAKLDRDSNLLWTYGDQRMRAHHDFQVRPDGTIYVLMRHACFLKWLRETPLQEDVVSILTPDGPAVRVVDCISVAEAFRDSEFADMLTADWFMKEGDPFHCNSIEVLDGTVPHPAFRAGNILLSIRNMDCLAVLDPERRAIVWVSRGRWQRQHEARVTPSGYVILFDNRTFDGRSRVVKYDVGNDEIVWSYSRDGFYSLGTGAEQLLPNGDLLITESQKGRIFEITLDGRIVWEYLNPMRMDDDETIVGFTRAYRIPIGYFDDDFRRELAYGDGPQG
jgi:hypothetical protein